MIAGAQLVAGCGAPSSPSVTPSSPSVTPSSPSVTPKESPTSTPGDNTTSDEYQEDLGALHLPATTIGALPAGAVTKALVLHSSIEPLPGLTVTLLGRAIGERVGRPGRVTRSWDVEIRRNKKTITTGLTGDELHLEGTGLGVSWAVDGPYGNEQVTVWPRETRPIGDKEAIDLATRAIAGVGRIPPGARVATTEGGTARIVFGERKHLVWVMVGLHSRRVHILAAEP